MAFIPKIKYSYICTYVYEVADNMMTHICMNWHGQIRRRRLIDKVT